MGGNESRQSPGGDCLDAVFEALAHRHRRLVLARLGERSPRDVEELLPTVDDDERRERLSVELYHIHLPKLADSGFVEWDPVGEVRRGSEFEEVAPILKLLDHHGDERRGEWP